MQENVFVGDFTEPVSVVEGGSWRFTRESSVVTGDMLWGIIGWDPATFDQLSAPLDLTVHGQVIAQRSAVNLVAVQDPGQFPQVSMVFGSQAVISAEWAVNPIHLDLVAFTNAGNIDGSSYGPFAGKWSRTFPELRNNLFRLGGLAHQICVRKSGRKPRVGFGGGYRGEYSLFG